MIRNQFSYWLTAEQQPGADHTLQDVLDALSASPMARPDGPMVFHVQDGKVHGEVEPSVGTVEEDGSLNEVLAKIAVDFPDFAFTFDERDEEDHANGVTTRYANGVLASRGRVRTLDPDEYDGVTTEAIAAYLEANGWPDAAIAIRTHKFP